jgi:hypothetical protein
MATKIIFDEKQMKFKNNTFFVNERNTTFDTSYDVYNPKTGKYVTFNLSHSTGSEWDPKTVWIYKNTDMNLELHISQDPNITKIRGNNYLNHKLKNNGTS